MKPKTKQQQLVTGLSAQLPELHKKVKPWAFDTCVRHIGYRTKKATSCLSCGNIWKGNATAKSDNCPACKRKLTIEDTLKRKVDQLHYFSAFDVKGNFQVIRYFQLRTWHKAGTAPTIACTEVIQMWMHPEGKNEVIARNSGGFGVYSSDHFHGDLEIRDRNTMGNKYNYYSGAVYPKSKFLPIYKRNGFKKNFHGITPYDLLTKLTDDSKVETLLKAKQFSLLRARVNLRPDSVFKHWSSIKVCIRNNYVVKDAITWLDYLDLLQFFGKDLRNHTYVCPSSLRKEHNRCVKKKDEHDKRMQAERRRKRILEDQEYYEQIKGIFFGLTFSENNLSVRVLEHVQEFIEEGEVHRHCVYTNEYHKKEDSLILSARVDGKPVETIEVSLSKMQVIQSRGLGNEPSEFHDQILKLMKKVMRQIKYRAKGMKMEAAA